MSKVKGEMTNDKCRMTNAEWIQDPFGIRHSTFEIDGEVT